MKLIALFLFTGLLSRAALPEDEALRVLQTSLNRTEREAALFSLTQQSQWSPAVAHELGRILVPGGTTRESGYAAHLLPRLGPDALPIMVKLLDSCSTDTGLLLEGIARDLNRTNETALVGALRPMIKRAPWEQGFFAGTTLAAFPLSPANAEAITRDLLGIRHWPMQFVGAVMVAKQAADTNLFQEMKSSEYATVRYAAAHYLHLHTFVWQQSFSRAPKPPRPEQVQRAEKFEAELRLLAADALRECLQKLESSPQPNDRIAAFRAIELMYPHVKDRRPEIAQTIRKLHFSGGSFGNLNLFDQYILRWEMNPHWAN